MLVDPSIDMRRKTSFYALFQQQVYLAATQTAHSTLEGYFSWSLVKLFRLLTFCQALVVRQNTLQRLLKEMPAYSEHSRDAGLLVRRGRELMSAELDLATDSSLNAEYAFLRAPGSDYKLSEVSNRIWYKTCYVPSQMQGQASMDQFAHFISKIAAAHQGCRSLVEQAEETVTWTNDCNQFTLMAQHLQLTTSQNGSDKAATQRGKHWDALGFQGEDPSTDFRAAGKLGLRHLTYFCQAHPLYATRMIRESGTALATIEGPWYPFALCAIHVTALLLSLIKTGVLQRHWLQAAACDSEEGVAALSDTLFSFLFIRCHLDWCQGVDKKELTSVLQFEAFFADFCTFMQRELMTKCYENDDFHVAGLKWW